MHIARAAVVSLLTCAAVATPVFAQGQTTGSAPAVGDQAAAYYNFAMGHLNAELAGAYGNRGEYVNKAIDFYREAMRLDPSAVYIAEELTEFYVQTGQLDKALTEADSLLKANPNNMDARKILARIYTRQIGDPDQGRIDQAMLKNAITQYQQITQQDPKDAESLSTLARLYRVSHDEASAEKAYRQVLALDGDDEDALNGLAMVLADRGDMPGAIEMLKKVIDKNPDPRTVVMLAEFYDQSRDFSHGADTWKQAVDLTNGENARVRAAWATDLNQAGRFDEALEAYKGLAADDPKNAALQLQIAEILERKSDFVNAAAAVMKARALGNTPEVRYADAELSAAQGKNAQAITTLQSLLTDTQKETYSEAERGQRMQILRLLGGLEQDSSKTSDAVQTYRQIADLDPSLGPQAEVSIIEALKAGKEFKAARQEADAALKKYSSDRTIAIVHASLLGELGQTDAAVNELKALPKPPSDVDKSRLDREVFIYIAQVQDKGKRFDDERKTLDSADALSKTPDEKQAILFMRGAMFERAKNFEGAEQAFRSILQDDPNNAGALNYLGYMYADRNIHLDEAQQLISKALDIDPGNGAYLDSLGWVHFRLNHLDQAAEELRQALDKVGKDPTVHDHLAEVYFKQGKIREAIQQWEASVSEWKASSPTDQDPVELAKVTKKLEGAKVRVAEKNR